MNIYGLTQMQRETQLLHRMNHQLEDPPDDDVETLNPESEKVLSCLSDPYCRRLLEAADEPKTAMELTDESGIPESTVYEKLDDLVNCSLVEKQYQMDRGSGYRTQYSTAFRRVIVEADADVPGSSFYTTVVKG